MTKLKLDTSNKYWQWVKDDMNSGEFNFPKNYWYDLAVGLLDIPLIAPDLPEVTVTPSTKDKQDLKTVLTGIPNKETRHNVLKLLSDALPDNTPFNLAATKLSEVYSKSGNPKVSSGGSFIGMLDGSNSGSRAHVNRLTNHMYNVNDWSEFIAELAHSYNDRNIKDLGYGGFFGSLSSAKSGTESVYSRPYNREYSTHQYTEPLLDSYIRTNDSSSNTLDDINSDINFYVQLDKLRYKYPKLQNAVEAFKDLFRKHGGPIHIKKKNKGKFTDYCGGKVTEECIRKGENSSNPTTRKRANFAANARKWKHLDGGKINYLQYFNYGK